MFGHDEDNQQQNTTVEPLPDATLATDGMGDDAAVQPQAPPADDAGSNGGFGADTGASDTSAPAVPEATVAGTDASSSVTPSAPTSGSDDLLDIKQQALQQLSPLVGHLDQTPEEKFRTTMMMIQASDNDSLIKTAYEAAQAITDEKARAQALLDIVNEINYFTQHNEA